VGTSQVIAPDGRTIAAIPAYQPGRLVAEVPLSRGTTPAVRLASAIEVGAATLGGEGLIGCLVLVLTTRRRPSDLPMDGVSMRAARYSMSG
jgi:apolipoprotein N-acyltransferase